MESGIGDLLRQLPTGIILMFCGSGLLLLLVVGYLIAVRNRRAAKAVPPLAVTPPMSDDLPDFGDLPDLDVLASTEALRIDPETDAEVPPVPVVSVPVAAPTGAQRVSLAEGEAVDAVEVLTVLRDVAEGGLIIRIGDQAYRNPPAVADAEFKRRFHTTLRDLGGAQQPVEAKRQSSPLPKAATHEVPAAESAATPLPGDLPKFKMPDAPVKPKRGQRPVAEPIPEINIAEAIESFLQHKLARSPEYGERSIHVRPALHGGVTIEVDGTFYESVGEVADEEVRDYLTATIAEWQARQ